MRKRFGRAPDVNARNERQVANGCGLKTPFSKGIIAFLKKVIFRCQGYSGDATLSADWSGLRLSLRAFRAVWFLKN